MDKVTVDRYLAEANKAGTFRRVEVKSKDLVELCKAYQESLTPNR